MRQATGWRLSLVLVIGLAPAVPRAEPESGPYERAVAQAIALLAERPAKVVVIDANDAKPEVREKLLRLDAFTLSPNAVPIEQNKVVYLVKQSAVLQEAATGSTLYEHVLAS